jgi:hypothetical protein
MPGGNGTGPLGEGPMTGRGMGFCILKKEDKDPNQITGFIGIEGKPYRQTIQYMNPIPARAAWGYTWPAYHRPSFYRSVPYISFTAVPSAMYPRIVWRLGRSRGRGRGRERGFRFW